MGQITLFPRSRLAHASAPPVDRVLIVSVSNSLGRDRPVPSAMVRINDRLGLRYFAEWEIQAGRVTPDLQIVSIEPSRPDRRIIAETVGGEVIEQDRAGALWIDGERLANGALISFCTLAADSQEQELALGQRAGWLFGSREEEAFSFSVRACDHLLWMYQIPEVLGSPGTFGGWMIAASHLTTRASDGGAAARSG